MPIASQQCQQRRLGTLYGRVSGEGGKRNQEEGRSGERRRESTADKFERIVGEGGRRGGGRKKENKKENMYVYKMKRRNMGEQNAIFRSRKQC